MGGKNENYVIDGQEDIDVIHMYYGSVWGTKSSSEVLHTRNIYVGSVGCIIVEMANILRGMCRTEIVYVVGG